MNLVEQPKSLPRKVWKAWVRNGVVIVKATLRGDRLRIHTCFKTQPEFKG